MAKTRMTRKKIDYGQFKRELQAEIGRNLKPQEDEFFEAIRSSIKDEQWNTLSGFVKDWLKASNEQLGRRLQKDIGRLVEEFDNRDRFMPT